MNANMYIKFLTFNKITINNINEIINRDAA